MVPVTAPLSCLSMIVKLSLMAGMKPPTSVDSTVEPVMSTPPEVELTTWS